MDEKPLNGDRRPTVIQQGRPTEIQVGQKLHELRIQHHLSLRELAERSGLNINTLSLVEKGKSSPSVGTLQQLAQALGIPIGKFFETEPTNRLVVFTPGDRRPRAIFGDTTMQNLGEDLNGNRVQPFVVEIKAGAKCGDQQIVHTGHEFVYCLDGSINYSVDDINYPLKPGDSLVFEAHLPHCWKNTGNNLAHILLILFPADEHDNTGERHFINKIRK
jgi:transcriptional regulator with XRE-family HTH domain